MTGPQSIKASAVFLCLSLLLTACSGSGSGAKPSYFKEGASSVKATVQAIDYSTHMVTLKGQSGTPVTFAVDKRVRNLERVKAGDRVRAQYYESVAIHVRDPDATGDDVATAAADFGDWTEAPDGSFGRETTITAVVEQVDRKNGTVALRGPAGNVHAFRVRNRRNLDNVNIGDEVVATHREALAVAIDPIGG